MTTKYVIGVDVGGTNTDAVLMRGKAIVAWHKSPTTLEVSHGVLSVIEAVLHKAGVTSNAVTLVKIGTTQFLNASLERDAGKLDRVAVIRLCGPYTQSVAPFRMCAPGRLTASQVLIRVSGLSWFLAADHRRALRIHRWRHSRSVAPPWL